MSEVESFCPRCDAQVTSDWSYCPHCSMMLSSSQAILSDRIRYVRHETAGRSRRRAVVRSLANLSVALSILFVVGSGVLLFHPAMVPRLFRPPDTIAMEPLPRMRGPEVPAEDEGAHVDFKWIEIPAGTFQHGPTGRTKKMELPGYMILKHEVTNGQWQEYLRGKSADRLTNTSRFEAAVPSHWAWKPGSDEAPTPHTSEDYDKPVVNVTWEQAQDFCRYYLVKIKGFEGAVLPTKYQWQKAARGDEDDRPYPWGTEYLRKGEFVRCNGQEARRGAPVSVLTFAGADGDVSPYGVVGMAGNVAEYVNAAEYPRDVQRPGFCGGAYFEGQEVRIYEEPATHNSRNHKWSFVGFRAVMPLPRKEGD